MESFEDEKTSLLQFMEYMEDILLYIDKFTCGHDIILDTFSKSKVPKTSFLFPHEKHIEVEESIKTKHSFEIKRRQNTTGSEICILVHLKLRINEEKFTVKKCHLELLENGIKKIKKVKDKASLRDYLCLYIVPVLGIFPLLHIYLHENISEYPITISEKPLFGLKTKKVIIFLNVEDQIVTSEDDTSSHIWDFDLNILTTNLLHLSNAFHDQDTVENYVFSNDLLLFLSYVIGQQIMKK